MALDCSGMLPRLMTLRRERLAPEDVARFRARYKRRQAIVWGGGFLLFLAAGLALLVAGSDRAQFAVMIAYVVLGGGLSFALWRCPRCGTSFGRAFRMDQCPGCRLDLEPEPPSRPAV
jgi:uncharacterized membrane protein